MIFYIIAKGSKARAPKGSSRSARDFMRQRIKSLKMVIEFEQKQIFVNLCPKSTSEVNPVQPDHDSIVDFVQLFIHFLTIVGKTAY